jgi:membrane protease YdiL (CAAX protease family)
MSIEPPFEPTEPAPERRSALVISWSSLLTGAVIVAFLTRYNLRNYTVWSTATNLSSRSFEEYLAVNITLLMLPPFLLVFGLFRKPADDFGFAPPQRGSGRVALLFFAVIIPMLLVASRFQEFRATYPLQSQAVYSWRFFFYFEIVYGFYLFCWEFFYRGFLTFGLRSAFGDIAAVGLQALAFGIMHYGKPPLEFISSFFGGAILGWLAIRARSFFPGFLLHWAIAFSLDCLAIHARHGIF